MSHEGSIETRCCKDGLRKVLLPLEIFTEDTTSEGICDFPIFCEVWAISLQYSSQNYLLFVCSVTLGGKSSYNFWVQHENIFQEFRSKARWVCVVIMQDLSLFI